MYEISLLVDCPGTPLLVRQYVLMLDIPGVQPPVTVISAPTTDQGDTLRVPAASPQTAVKPIDQATSQNAARSLRSSQAAIPAGKAYRVRAGDTLSTIAARINGRAPDTIWSVASLLFTTNPQAFIRNNPDLIKLGSLINIPDAAELVGLETGRATVTPATVTTPSFAQPETIPETTSESLSMPAPVPAPIPAPVATSAATNRPEVFVTEPERPESTTLTNESEIGIAVGQEEIRTYSEQLPAVSTPEEGKAGVITPFVDEQPVSAVVAPEATSADSTAVVPSLFQSSRPRRVANQRPARSTR